MENKDNRYQVSDEERKDILNQHISAASRQYLKENVVGGYDTPFRNSGEGDSFREWVNCYYPAIANQYTLEPDGSYRNSTIRRVFNVKVNSPKDYKDYGDNNQYSHLISRYNLMFNEGDDVELGRLYLANNLTTWSRVPFKCKKNKK